MGRLATGVRVAIAAGCLVLVGGAARAGGLHLQHGSGRLSERPVPATTHAPSGRSTSGGHGGQLPGAVGIAFAVAGSLAALAALLLIVRAIRRTGWRLRLPSFSVAFATSEDPAAAPPDAELVAQGAAAALAALDGGDDPRAAVIAAYAGMVAALDRAGTPGAAVLTPGRLLLRAAAAGLVDGDDARGLTTVFERARFSTQEITAADVTDARSRLAAVRARLGEAVPA